MKESIKSKIVDVIERFGNKTLLGLMEFPDIKEMSFGNLEWELKKDGQDLNVIIITDVNKDFIVATKELIDSDIIDMKATDILNSTFDGKVYEIPVAESLRVYKVKHWLPMIIIKGKNFNNYRKPKS